LVLNSRIAFVVGLSFCQHGQVLLHAYAQEESAEEDCDKEHEAKVYQGSLRGIQLSVQRCEWFLEFSIFIFGIQMKFDGI
jgi:hypothetical protein